MADAGIQGEDDGVELLVGEVEPLVCTVDEWQDRGREGRRVTGGVGWVAGEALGGPAA